MAPIYTARAEKEKRFHAVLAFANNLLLRLQSPDGVRDGILLAELQKRVNEFPSNTPPATIAAEFDKLESRGLTLWNLATRLKRGDNSDGVGVMICWTRVFAFLLLDMEQQTSRRSLETPNRHGKGTGSIRLMKISLKAAKYCIDQKQLDLSLKAFEKAARYEDQLANPDAQLTPENTGVHSSLSAEYYILRTAHSWLQGRLDLAEHMFSKALFSDKKLEPRIAEDIADTLYEIGNDLLKKKQYELSVRWLERSYGILAGQDLENLSENAGELRCSVLSCLVRALLELKTDTAKDRARDLVHIFENDYGAKLVVLLLKLELILAGTEFDEYEYYRVMQMMVRVVALNDSSFKTIMIHVRKLKERSPKLACQLLDEFLSTRLFSTERVEWIEKAFVTRLLISTSQASSADALESLGRFVTTISTNLTVPLGASATHSAQSLLWKQVESHFGQGMYEIAASWCRVALHEVFAKSGEFNNAKIARKMIQCALETQDNGKARELFNKMSDIGKAAPLTRFLMFKVALRTGDAEFAMECLDVVSASTSESASQLFGCVLEAQSTGDKRIAVAALQRVLEKYEHRAPAGVNVPCLLRVTARILIAEIDSSKVAHEDSIVSLCKIFEGGSRCPSKKLKGGPDYNEALKSCADWNPRYTLRVLQACTKFIDLYPKDMDASTLSDLALRRMFCDFLCVSLLAVLARSEDNIETQLQFYLNLRGHAEAFHKQLQDQLDRLEVDDAKEDLLKKYGTLAAFDLEAAVHLKSWDDLGQIIEVFEPLADIILQAKAPATTTLLTLQVCSSLPQISFITLTLKKKIVNTTWRLPATNPIDKLSRWIRCLFQIALSNDLNIAEQLLHQALSIARDSKIDTPYPPEELEWLATTTFNRAVDFYCASDDAACKRWAELALSVALFGDDQGIVQTTNSAMSTNGISLPNGVSNTQLPPGDSGVTLVEDYLTHPHDNSNFMSVKDFTMHPHYNNNMPQSPRYPDATSTEHHIHYNANGFSPTLFDKLLNDQMSIGNFIVCLEDPNTDIEPPDPTNSMAPFKSGEPEPLEEPLHGMISTETEAFYLRRHPPTSMEGPRNAGSDAFPQKRKQPGSEDGESSGCEEYDEKRQRKIQCSTLPPSPTLAQDPDLDESLGAEHLAEIIAGSSSFEEEFMSEIGFFAAESPEPDGEQETHVFISQLSTAKHDPGWVDPGWVGVGLPKSFRELYNALTLSPIAPLPSPDLSRRDGRRVRPLDADKLRKRLQQLVDNGWDDLGDHSDLKFPILFNEDPSAKDSSSQDPIDRDSPYQSASNSPSDHLTGE
ncbi:MAG: hypothetical protein M1840_003028 [Geoglossum simile]|nr:MAG: hypothetical protein M1840_003028 [Geoglossum simile]